MTPTTAVTVAGEISEADILAALRSAGLAEPEAQGSGVNRVTLNGLMFTFDNGDVATSNPKTGAPAFRARLLDAPIEYQAAWLTERLAEAIDRKSDANSFCKSHFANPNEARKFSATGAECNQCPIGPFVRRDALPPEADDRKCQWKADLPFQLVDPNGEISDPTVHTLTLSTTGIIEFKGTAKEPTKGSVSDLCFTQRLARFGMTHDPKNPQRGLVNALTALSLGGVIADVRAVMTSNQDRSRTWSVPVFEPIDLIDVSAESAPALPESTTASGTGNDGNLPF